MSTNRSALWPCLAAVALAACACSGSANAVGQGLRVEVRPAYALLTPLHTQDFAAWVTGASTTAVTWSVQEGDAGGTVVDGHYTAPATTGSYHVVATLASDATKKGVATVTVGTVDTSIVPAERATVWNPGLMSAGGIPPRAQVCANVSPPAGDATSTIQAAINGCPAGQVVQLAAGTYNLSSTLLITKGITLRGMGPTQTRLFMKAGTGQSLIAIGTQWFKFVQTTNLAATAGKGGNQVTLASPLPLKRGEIVEIDQLPDLSITEFNPNHFTSEASYGWFNRPHRMLGQILEVASIDPTNTVVTFTTPLHIGFDAPTYQAQLSRFSSSIGGPQVDVVKFAGVEDLYLNGGQDGNIKFRNAAYSWIKNIESDRQKGEGVGIDASFRCELRDSYIHTTVDPNPGGGGYGISFSFYSADNLVENNISWNMNKVMVMRASGGGNVIGYNYMDDGWIGGVRDFVETGLNASHMTTPHYELFEGNQSFNFDGDNTWGSSVYITVFRNHLTGKRHGWPALVACSADLHESGACASLAPQPVMSFQDQANPRAIGLMEGHQFYTFIGNVLGTAGQNPSPNSGYTYESTAPWGNSPVGMWRLGYNPENWGAAADTRVLSTAIRDGNFDYATNGVRWDRAAQTIPDSLYLPGRPEFFGPDATAMPWPWVNPTGTTKVATLPARARFEAMASPH